MRTLCLGLALVMACGTSAPPPKTFGGDRPVTLEVPAKLVPGMRYPLVLVLHGYGATGKLQEAYFGLNHLAADNQAFVLAPDGLTDSTGHQFWNADPACCDFDGTHPDDVGYLGGLIDAVSAAWPIDPAKVYVIGHSNGGYMAYRLACDRADVVSSIVVLAGAAASDPSTCNPTRPVDVLHLHGTADTEVPYSTAMPSEQQWATHDGCDPTLAAAGPALNLDGTSPDDETTPMAAGCPAGVDLELWTMQGIGHIPAFTAQFEPTIWAWLGAHHRS